MQTGFPVHLSRAEIDELGREIDQISAEVKGYLGESDARYLRRLIKIQRSMALAGRLVLFAALAFLPRFGHALASWPLCLAILATGTLLLALSKILENMEIAHNIMHGQWDWMQDPEIQSASWEWDSVCPAVQWRHSHNVVHHTWTNVLGRDRDIGYGMLRVTEKQAWHPFYLLQPVTAVVMALFFEWFIALHDLEINRLLQGRKDRDVFRRQAREIGRKVTRQALKDYVLWPLLAGPFFLYIAAANFFANIIRNLWTYLIIFCGHFPTGVHVFTREQVRNETRGQWYVRQMLGSCNIEGGRLFHILSGNLSHQIEHHLFPDMPSNRYPEVAPRVEALCARYGLPYNKGSLSRQFGKTTLEILRLSVPWPVKSRLFPGSVVAALDQGNASL